MSVSGPTLSSTGVGSGLDVNAIMTKLMAVEYLPYNRMTTEISSYKTQLSSVGQMQNLVATMRDKAQALTNPSVWGAKAVTTADAAVVTGTGTPSAVAGNYAITVQQLAARQTAVSGTFASSAAEVGAGKLTIEMGSWDGPPATAFTGKPGSSAIEVDISGDTSLAGVRDKINAANAGVTATIVNDASGARLSLQSTNSGAVNGFRISATETADDGNPATGLSALAVDATQSGAPSSITQWSANARASINGIAVESASNVFEGVSDGLTVTVNKVSTTPVNLSVNADNSAVTTAVNDFITAYNAMNSYLRTQTKYDEATKTAGPLQGDATMISLASQLRGVINEPSSASSQWSMLSQVGITMQQDGSLKVDSAKLAEAMKNPDEVRKLMGNDGTTTGASGFMDRFRDLGSRVLASDGSLEVKEQSIQERIKNATNRQASLQVRLDQTEARLRAQYQALDKSMASLNSLSSYVVQQMAMLNANG
ncbi:MAG: flagellar filament capping protein FliD [Proteobacteria bacterium]|nr:flagellar filament capping protein FliD [Pseudomonadota bacterium]